MERLHRISGVGLHFVRGEEREQPCEIGAQLVHIRNGENHPCQRYDEDDVGMFQQMGAFQKFAVDVFFQCQKHEEDQSPQHKVPACTVPQSGKRPDCQHVPHGFPLAHTAAAQREIDIVLEPASQRDVPSSPELAGGAGHIREIEVLGKLEAQHFSHANCHHGIAGEVEVDLKAIGKRSQPRIRGGDTIIPDNGQIIPQTAHGVRQQRLGTQSEHKGFHALLQQTDIDPTVFQLRLNFTVHADRTGDQLREHAEVHAQIQNTPCGTRLSGVDIDQVGRDLKGEEADAAVFGLKPGSIKINVPDMVRHTDTDGSVYYTKVNADGQEIRYDASNTYSVSADDYQVLGHNSPDWTMGFQNTLTYKDFDLSIYMYMRWGQMLKYSVLTDYDPTGLNNYPTYFNVWSETNPSNDFPAMDASIKDKLSYYPGFAALSYVDGSFFKIKNITLGYTMPDKLAKKLGLGKLRVYGTITNPFVIAKSHLLKDYDPEMNGGLNYPLTKQLVFGLNLSF